MIDKDDGCSSVNIISFYNDFLTVRLKIVVKDLRRIRLIYEYFENFFACVALCGHNFYALRAVFDVK